MKWFGSYLAAFMSIIFGDAHSAHFASGCLDLGQFHYYMFCGSSENILIYIKNIVIVFFGNPNYDNFLMLYYVPKLFIWSNKNVNIKKWIGWF